MTKTRLRPRTSPSWPPSTTKAATARRYAFSAHARVVEESVRSSAMALTAVLMAVVFTAIRNSAMHEVTSAPHG
jgi:hypothetical protein